MNQEQNEMTQQIEAAWAQKDTPRPRRGGALVEQARSRHEEVKRILTVDMGDVLALLAEATATAQKLDDLRISEDDRAKSTLQAEIGRNLNRLSDMLEAASAESKMEYWRIKGFADPRD